MGNFRKALKRRITKSGDARGKRLPRSELFNELIWLKDLSTPRTTTCNVDILAPISPTFSNDTDASNKSVTANSESELANLPMSATPTISQLSSPSPSESVSMSRSDYNLSRKRKSDTEAIDVLLAKALVDGDSN